MKIVMLGHKFIPSRSGGIEIVVHELATRLVQNGHEVTVLNRRNGETTSKTSLISPGIFVRTVPTINAKGLAAASSSFFAALIARFIKPDVVHFHAEGPALMVPIVKSAKIRTVVTIHGLDWQRAKWGKFASWYLRMGEKIAAKHADEIIVLSKNVQQYFQETYGRSTNYIPNGVDRVTPRPPRSILEKHGLTTDSYLLFVGRVVPEKGLGYLLQAYKEIQTDMKLVIAGGHSDSQEYFETVSSFARADSRVKMLGHVEGKELEELYSNAFIYILPSDIEGMPMSLLEALAYGNCCLVSDIPENMEVIKNHGFSFRQGNYEDLKSILEKFLVMSLYIA